MDNGFLAGISYVDLIIAGGILLFVIIGIVRGFTADLLGLTTWIGALFTTILAFPHLEPIILTYITTPFYAKTTLGFLLYLLSLILLVAIVKGITSLVRKSMLSGLDRTLGIVSGSFRATALLTVVYLGALMFWKPGATPEAFQKAKLLPFINTSAQLVHQYLIPDDRFSEHLLSHMYGPKRVTKNELSPEDLVKSLSSPKAGSTPEKDTKKDKASPLEQGYKNLERQALESLIDNIAPKEK